MGTKLIFITGGARSGKSDFAEGLARAHPGPVAYIPTATISDPEMARRVELHRQRRPAHWLTVECGDSLAQTLSETAEHAACLVVDCLTIYLVRLLPPDLPDAGAVAPELLAAVEQRVEQEMAAVEQSCRASNSDIIVVSNEVGDGLVPAYPSGRLFRDAVGRANRSLAAAADHAYLIVAGCPLDLKAKPPLLPWEVEP
jgi:adenosylcobinamide kinase/adenosylcobinamide-phosphate guanylyltransferase